MKTNLNEFHEKVDVFSVKLAGEVLDGLVKILRQRVEVSSDGELGLSYLFNVLYRRHRRHVRTFASRNTQMRNFGLAE